ncbi:amidohydrolase family protein [Paenibacillus filicis]|uniref:Amidohydrolase family protein n=1 Tax=Paenibacillus filicis TaxID=669464 RepID=A0ABU9DKN3_9BACL
MKTVLKIVNAALPLQDERQLYTLVAEDGVWLSVTEQPSPTSSPDSVSLEQWDGESGDPGALLLLDAGGNVVLPGFVDAHMHLDKAFSLPKVGNVSGTLQEAVLNYSTAVPSFTKRELKARMMRAALQAISFGTTVMRTHLDFHVKYGKDVALRTIEAALEVKEELAAYATLQLFPMLPYLDLTSDALELAEEVLRMGVTGLGGAPHLSPFPNPDIDRLFALADRLGCPIDLHTDESDDPCKNTVLHIARRTMEYGWAGRVTVDHLCSLAAMPDADAEAAISLMAEAKLGAVTLPGANLYLQGRHDGFPARRGVTRVKELLAAGIPLATASDNIHDPFHPFGRGDLLQIGLVTAYAAHMGSPSDIRTVLRMMTTQAAQVAGLARYGIAAGNAADFVIFDAAAVEELFTMVPERRWVWSKGLCVKKPGGKPEWKQRVLKERWDEASELITFRSESADAVKS